MGKASRGAKAGLVSGLLVGLIAGSISYMTLIMFKEEIIAYFRDLLKGVPVPIDPETIYSTTLICAPIAALAVFVMVGLIAGALMGRGWEKIPGKGLVKGFIVGLIIFVIFEATSLALGGLAPAGPPVGLGIYDRIINLLLYILWGTVASALYIRWTVKAGEFKT